LKASLPGVLEFVSCMFEVVVKERRGLGDIRYKMQSQNKPL